MEVNGFRFIHYVRYYDNENPPEEPGMHGVFYMRARARVTTFTRDGLAPLENLQRGLELAKRQILQEEINADQIVVFLYTGHVAMLPLLARFAETLGSRNVSVFFNIFYHDNSQDLLTKEITPTKKLITGAGEILEDVNPAANLLLTGDTERIADLYSQFFHRPVRRIPLPLPLPATDLAPSDPEKREITAERPIDILFLGHAITRAGYDLLYDLYEKVTREEQQIPLRFTIRHSTADAHPHVHARLVSQHYKIRHFEGRLSDELYEQLLSESDIVVQPNRADLYPIESSGIFIDAVLKRKIVVVPDGTWMADRLQAYGSGETFRSGDSSSLAEKVLRIIREFPLYARRTARSLGEMRAMHSPEALASFFTEGVGQGRQSDHPENFRKRVDTESELLATALGLVGESRQQRQALRGASQKLDNRDVKPQKRIGNINEEERQGQLWLFYYCIGFALRYPWKSFKKMLKIFRGIRKQ